MEVRSRYTLLKVIMEISRELTKENVDQSSQKTLSFWREKRIKDNGFDWVTAEGTRLLHVIGVKQLS